MLGASIVLTNRTGGVGAIATKFVQVQDADGYTLLMGAENPQIYKVMGLGDIDYGDFIPISVLARGVPLIVANTDAPFNTFKEMVEYVQANPGEVKIGSTGPGGVPSVVTAMLSSQVELPMTAVPYDGDGPAQTALMGGAVDVLPAVLGAAIENVKAGRVKPIAIIDTERNPLLPDVPAIVEDYPDFAQYLPWGPFFGIFVKEGTPEEAVTKLQAAFKESGRAAGIQVADGRARLRADEHLRRRGRGVPEPLAVGHLLAGLRRRHRQGLARGVRHPEALTAERGAGRRPRRQSTTIRGNATWTSTSIGASAGEKTSSA